MAVLSKFRGIPPRMIDALSKKERGVIRKPRRYFEPYDLLFQKFIGQRPKILELGVEMGGSLYAWKRYFKNAEIYGSDLNLNCKEYEGDGIKVFVGNHTNGEFLKLIVARGPFDIIIDDGSHQKDDVIRCFETLFPHLKSGGYYAIEDMGASYWAVYGGGKGKGAMEYFKELLDELHAPFISDDHDYSGNCTLVKERFPEIDSILFWSCLCIIGKKSNSNHCGGDDINL